MFKKLKAIGSAIGTVIAVAAIIALILVIGPIVLIGCVVLLLASVGYLTYQANKAK